MTRHSLHIGKASETSFLGSDMTVVLTKNDNGQMEELQQTHYYPFGGIIADLSSGRDVQNRLYNGKEQDFANNLFWLDYGARQYDATRGQFTTPDPLAEKYYPWNYFTYCMNNPVKFIDPDGRKVVNSKGVNIFYINSNNQLCYSNIASSNEKMVFDGMMLTNIGKKMLRQMIASPISINMQFKDVSPDDTEKNTTYADTQQYKKGIKNYGITKDRKGKFRTGYATITFYMNSIVKSLNQEWSQNYGLTLTEAVGAEATHEGVHASDEEEIHKDIAAANGGTPRTKEDSEKKPREIEQQFRDELTQNKEE